MQFIAKMNEMRKKILYCASSVSHIMNFHLPYLKFFYEQGYQVDVIVESQAEIPYTDNVIALPFEKRLFAVNNLRAVWHMKHFLLNNSYDIISIHTTLAAAVIRLAMLLSSKRGGKVYYTSHGYFFSDQKKLSEWLYLFVEKLFSQVTDILMVMNQVDYNMATYYRLGKEIKFIHGMGLDLEKFTNLLNVDKEQLKLAAGFDTKDFLILYVAEMSKRKNQAELIQAFSRAAVGKPYLKLLLAGDGRLKDEYINLARKLGFSERIIFLGHVIDMPALYNICDLAVSTSRSEGLPFNVMEAMACGLPVIASRIKGNVDLLRSLEANCLYDLGDVQGLANLIKLYYLNNEVREQVGQENLRFISQYNLKEVMPEIIELLTANSIRVAN